MSKLRPALVLFASIIGGLSGAGLSATEERRVQIPGGWEVAHGAGVAVCQTGVLVNLEPLGSDAYYTYSKVMFIKEGGGISLTDIPRRISWIECSPAGDYVLLHHFGPEGQQCTLVSLPNGEIVWTKRTDEFLRFAPTGKFIYGRNSGPAGHYSVTKIEDPNKIKLYNVNGKPRGIITLKEVPADYSFVDDTTLIVETSRAVTVYRVSRSRLIRLWSHPIPKYSNLSVGAWAYTPDLILFWDGVAGRTKIFTPDGKILYDFDNATALPVSNPRSYRLKPWTQGQLLFYNGDPEAFVLDVAAGVLKSKRLDIAPPPGFKLLHFAHFTAVFVSEQRDEVIVRPIAP